MFSIIYTYIYFCFRDYCHIKTNATWWMHTIKGMSVVKQKFNKTKWHFNSNKCNFIVPFIQLASLVINYMEECHFQSLSAN